MRKFGHHLAVEALGHHLGPEHLREAEDLGPGRSIFRGTHMGRSFKNLALLQETARLVVSETCSIPVAARRECPCR